MISSLIVQLFIKLALVTKRKKQNKESYLLIILMYFLFEFQMDTQDLKGTMSIGELWSNKDKSKFLKENKIYINKVKLV